MLAPRPFNTVRREMLFLDIYMSCLRYCSAVYTAIFFESPQTALHHTSTYSQPLP